MADPDAVLQTIRSLVERCKKDSNIDRDTRLFAEGIGLESLETAELSAMLEDEFGTDPFGGDVMPQTVGAILDFYASAAATS